MGGCAGGAGVEHQLVPHAVQQYGLPLHERLDTVATLLPCRRQHVAQRGEILRLLSERSPPAIVTDNSVILGFRPAELFVKGPPEV